MSLTSAALFYNDGNTVLCPHWPEYFIELWLHSGCDCLNFGSQWCSRERLHAERKKPLRCDSSDKQCRTAQACGYRERVAGEAKQATR
jgi:hypothetical protein